jgi:MEKHLA domain.
MKSAQTTTHVQLLLDSYRRWTGKDLVSREDVPELDAESLWEAPFVVVSHGTEADPVLNYGNRAALALWEMDWEEFCGTPSRLTAESPQRGERERLLKTVTERGYIDDYRGIRISKSGRRFQIEDAIVWNLLDGRENYRGQAAAFSKWIYLP